LGTSQRGGEGSDTTLPWEKGGEGLFALKLRSLPTLSGGKELLGREKVGRIWKGKKHIILRVLHEKKSQGLCQKREDAEKEKNVTTEKKGSDRKQKGATPLGKRNSRTKKSLNGGTERGEGDWRPSREEGGSDREAVSFNPQKVINKVKGRKKNVNKEERRTEFISNPPKKKKGVHYREEKKEGGLLQKGEEGMIIIFIRNREPRYGSTNITIGGGASKKKLREGRKQLFRLPRVCKGATAICKRMEERKTGRAFSRKKAKPGSKGKVTAR